MFCGRMYEVFHSLALRFWFLIPNQTICFFMIRFFFVFFRLQLSDRESRGGVVNTRERIEGGGVERW